jgi:sigma-B regulation protein RsbU (phosphoserine phosphatase)
MSPRMKRRKKPVSPNLFRLFLAFWILASLGYWIAGIVDLWDTRVHWDQHVNIPFRYDSDSRKVDKNGLEPEARTAGLKPRDRIEQLNGAPYSGLAQWSTVLSDSHPGDILDVDVTHPDGSKATATITLVRPPYAYGRMSPLVAFWQGFLLVGLLAGVCLAIGYWVVLTRPTDRNAWLLLILLTFPSVVFINPLVYPPALLFSSADSGTRPCNCPVPRPCFSSASISRNAPASTRAPAGSSGFSSPFSASPS